MNTPAVAKKDIQKLQRAIVDGLEDVKAQDIQVFDTEHLSSLFERVIIASGTSNRQTKGLAASVRDAVREAGFSKPRIEGEDNGEWIIVDCGQAVVHIMQPTFRQYYHLEELWGEKPVRLKLGAAKPAMSEGAKAAAAAKSGTKAGAKPGAKSGGTSGTGGDKSVTPEPNLRRASAAKKGVAEAFPSKAQLKKAEAAKAPARKSASKPPTRKRTDAADAPSKASTKPVPKPVSKVVVGKVAVGKVTAGKEPAKKGAGKPVAKKAAPRKA